MYTPAQFKTPLISLLFTLLVLIPLSSYAKPMGFVEFIKDDVDGVDHLKCLKEAVLTPNNEYLYAVSFCDDAINIFDRNALTGALSFKKAIVGDDVTGEGLRSINFILMHPNGKFLYAQGRTGGGTGPDDEFGRFRNSVFSYAIDQESGALSLIQEFDGVGTTYDMTMSADGLFVYVGGAGGIRVLKTDAGGMLSASSSVDEVNIVDGARESFELKISPNGNHLYSETRRGDGVAVLFDRDSITGVLTPPSEFPPSGFTGTNSLSASTEFAFSPGGEHFYMFSTAGPNTGDRIVLFDVDQSTGVLTYKSELTEIPDNFPSARLNCPTDIRISKNGKLLYFVDKCAGTFQLWSRDLSSGELTYLDAAVETEGGVPYRAFAQVEDIVVSADGHFAYIINNYGISVFNLTANIELSSVMEIDEQGDGLVIRGSTTVTNLGPSSAHSVEVSLAVDVESLGVVSVTSTSGACVIEDVVKCNIPVINNNGTEIISFEYTVPGLGGSIELWSTVVQSEIDSGISEFRETFTYIHSEASIDTKPLCLRVDGMPVDGVQELVLCDDDEMLVDTDDISDAGDTADTTPVITTSAPKKKRRSGASDYLFLLLPVSLYCLRRSALQRVS